MGYTASRVLVWAVVGVMVFAMAPAGQLAATGNEQACDPHEPIRILEDHGSLGFVWDDPITGEEVYRPGSGVVAGDGTASNPYEIAGWCISGAAWDPPAVIVGTCNWGPDGPDPESTGIIVCGTSAHFVLHNSTVNLWEHGTGLGNVSPDTGTVEHTSHQNNSIQLYVNDAPGLSIENNMVHGFDTTELLLRSERGIEGRTTDATVKDNAFVGASTLVDLDGPGVRVADNRFDSASDNHIHTFGDGAEIANNTLETTIVDTPPRHGIWSGGDDVRIEGNEMTGYRSIGIIADSGTGAQVAHNQLTTSDGVGVSVSAHDVRVHNTTVDGGSRGVSTAADADGVTIENVTVTGAETGLNAYKSNATTFTHNEVTGYTNVGVRVDQAENTTLRRTNLDDTNGTGLEVLDTPAAVDARYNWWGCADGPDDAACDDVVGDAVFEPWLTAENPEAGASN